jgi:Fe-S-cluster containining protein
MNKPCTECTAKCCKNYDVFIDHEDLKNIDIQYIKKIEYHRSFGYVPKFILWSDESKKKWILCLDNPNRVCSFLKDDKCSIYEKRPLICRTYPHYVDNDKVKTMKNLCPIKWNLTKAQESELRVDYEKLLVNFLAFETICDQWNKIVTKEDDLKNFLIFVKNYKFND